MDVVTTVVTLGNSDGERRCTAACHDATGPVCACLCGGRFHGAARKPGGVEEALQEAGEQFLASLKAEDPESYHAIVRAVDRSRQLALPMEAV